MSRTGFIPNLGQPDHVIVRCNACLGPCEVPWQLKLVQITRCRACTAEARVVELERISRDYVNSTDPLLDKLERLSNENANLKALLKDCRLLIADQAWGCATYFSASYDGKEIAVVQKLPAAFLTHWNPAYPGASFTSIPPKYAPIAPDQLPAWVRR